MYVRLSVVISEDGEAMTDCDVVLKTVMLCLIVTRCSEDADVLTDCQLL